MIRVYTDGAASGNGKECCIAGYGYVILDTEWSIIRQYSSRLLTMNDYLPTSIRAEMMPVIEALSWLKDSTYKDQVIRVYSDSAYIVNCMTQKWYVAWSVNNWVTSSGKPVANKDLWVKILELCGALKVSFKKVKGHSGHEFNDMCDFLAKKEVEIQKLEDPRWKR